MASKKVHVVVWEAGDRERLLEALRRVGLPNGINQLYFEIEDDKLRMILQALKEGASSS
jgi:hypothetical protein